MAEDLHLHDYQERVRSRMLAETSLGLFLDPGLGKTAISLQAYDDLRMEFEVSRMLVVAPLRVAYSVWPAEVTKWRQFVDIRVHLLHGKGKTRQAFEDSRNDILVINPEGLSWLRKQTNLCNWPEMLVVDESTKFKKAGSGRSKNLRALLDRFERRYILTGTPAPNGLKDLHGQVFLLDQGDTLGEDFKDYQCEYFIPVETPHGYDWKPRRGSTQRIYEKLAPIVVRLDARDHLELPELINTTIDVELPPPARKLYTELKREMAVFLDEGDVVAVNPGVLTGKCRQVANGSVYYTVNDEVAQDERGAKRWAHIHDAKAEALADLVEELSGQPLLVAFEHKHELEVIQKTLKPIVGTAPHIAGGVSAAKGRRIEQQWNAGSLPVLLLHPQSAAHGLNLQFGGHYLAWYSITWDLELYDQMVRRVWRQGQKETTFVYHLAARDTVDKTITRALERKSRTQAELLDLLREDIL